MPGSLSEPGSALFSALAGQPGIGHYCPDFGAEIRIQHGTGHPDDRYHHYRLVSILCSQRKYTVHPRRGIYRLQSNRLHSGGAYAAKALTIISDHAPQIADIVTRDMDRGVTLIPAIGAYSKQAKHMAYCVVSRQEIRRLTAIAKSVDPRAFIIISDVHDVHGEGFKED